MQSGFNINLLRVTLYNVDLNQRYLKIHALYSTDDFEFVFFFKYNDLFDSNWFNWRGTGDVTRIRMYIVQSIVYGFKEITPGVIFITNFHGWRDIFASINFDFMLC